MAYLVDVHFLKCTLENFEVLYIFVLEVGAEFDALHGHGSGKQHVHVLTIGRSCRMMRE